MASNSEGVQPWIAPPDKVGFDGPWNQPNPEWGWTWQIPLFHADPQSLRRLCGSWTTHHENPAKPSRFLKPRRFLDITHYRWQFLLCHFWNSAPRFGGALKARDDIEGCPPNFYVIARSQPSRNGATRWTDEAISAISLKPSIKVVPGQ